MMAEAHPVMTSPSMRCVNRSLLDGAGTPAMRNQLRNLCAGSEFFDCVVTESVIEPASFLSPYSPGCRQDVFPETPIAPVQSPKHPRTRTGAIAAIAAPRQLRGQLGPVASPKGLRPFPFVAHSKVVRKDRTGLPLVLKGNTIEGWAHERRFVERWLLSSC